LARVLIVGCGCRGRALAEALRADGHAVRGTTRTEAGLAAIEAAGAEAVVADPDRLGTLMVQLGDVTAVCWLLASADGSGAAELHGPRLQTLLERLVDTPVRGFVYERSSAYPAGEQIVARAQTTFRLPCAVVSPGDDLAEAVARVLSG
jgi:nucleoside-diphosphate-sugar epimerase